MKKRIQLLISIRNLDMNTLSSLVNNKHLKFRTQALKPCLIVHMNPAIVELDNVIHV